MCSASRAGPHQPDPSFEGVEMGTEPRCLLCVPMPQAKTRRLRALAAAWGSASLPGSGWCGEVGLLPPFPAGDTRHVQAAGQGTASAWEQDGEGRSDRKEKALRWRRQEGNCRGRRGQGVQHPLPGRRFNADQLADVCFCDLWGEIGTRCAAPCVHPCARSISCRGRCLCCAQVGVPGFSQDRRHLSPRRRPCRWERGAVPPSVVRRAAGVWGPVQNSPEALGGAKEPVAPWCRWQCLVGCRGTQRPRRGEGSFAAPALLLPCGERTPGAFALILSSPRYLLSSPRWRLLLLCQEPAWGHLKPRSRARPSCQHLHLHLAAAPGVASWVLAGTAANPSSLLSTSAQH